MTFQYLIDLINSSGVVVGFVTLPLGLLIGYWLRIEGDKRKEFNEVALRIRVALQSSQSGNGPWPARIEQKDMELFSHLLRWWQKSRFEEAWTSYETEWENTELQQDKVYGTFIYPPRTERIKKSLQRVISFTSLR